MKSRFKQTVLVSIVSVAVSIGIGGLSAQAATDGTRSLGEVLGTGATLGVSDPNQNDVVQIGDADVDLEKGIVKFKVGEMGPSESGTLPTGTLVQGHLVCNKAAGMQATVVSTPSIPVQENGTAEYAGAIDLPAECHNQSQLAFMIRVVSQDSWMDE